MKHYPIVKPPLLICTVFLFFIVTPTIYSQVSKILPPEDLPPEDQPNLQSPEGKESSNEISAENFLHRLQFGFPLTFEVSGEADSFSGTGISLNGTLNTPKEQWLMQNELFLGGGIHSLTGRLTVYGIEADRRTFNSELQFNTLFWQVFAIKRLKGITATAGLGNQVTSISSGQEVTETANQGSNSKSSLSSGGSITGTTVFLGGGYDFEKLGFSLNYRLYDMEFLYLVEKENDDLDSAEKQISLQTWNLVLSWIL